MTQIVTNTKSHPIKDGFSIRNLLMSKHST